MSIVEMEGFDWLLNTNGLDVNAVFAADGWTGEVSSMMRIQTPGRFGFGNAIAVSRYSGTDFKQAFKILPERVTGSFVVGFAWNQNDMEVDDNPASFVLYDGLNEVTRLTCAFHAFGKITCAGFSSGIGRRIDGVWNYIQIKGTIGSPGLFELVMNGDILMSSPSVNFGEFDCWSLTLPSGNWAGYSIDDVYILDGSAPNNDYLGNVRVVAQRPVSDGDNIDLIPVGAATNWQASDNPRLSATPYVETDVVGDYDLYNMNPNVSARDIFGVMVKTFVRQNNGVQIRGGPIIKTGGLEFGSNDRGLASGYRSVTEVWDRNPDTTNPWTSAELNLIQAGPKLTSSA